MNLRAGIDTPPPAEFLFVKVNLPFDGRQQAIDVLEAIERVRREYVDAERHFGEVPDAGGGMRPGLVVDDWGLNLLLAFGLRFFMGPLADRGSEEAIQNFPPGGVFKQRVPKRFGIERHVPVYLRTMAASGDEEFVKRRLTAKTGTAPSDAETKAAYRRWLSDCESDLLLYFESNHRFLKHELWDAVRKRVVEPMQLEVVSAHDSNGRGDGRDLIGWHDPKSNLDDHIANDPEYYRSKVYLPHPAPAYPGEPTTNRDHPLYDGGTYLVHRRYIEHLDKWNSDEFTVTDAYGRTFSGEEARVRAIGRDRETGKVVHESTGELLEPEMYASEVHLSFRDSHIRQARGGQRDRNPAPFRAPFPPLTGDEENVFNIQDIRVRRRGGNSRDVDPETGKVTYNLHFVCFQNNIQQTGFEFINNIWLLNPLFRGVDHILDPDNGIGEPVEGAYYFVPPAHRDYAGEVFFE